MKKKLLYLFITISSISFGQTLEKSYTSNTSDSSGNDNNYVFLAQEKIFYLTLNSSNSEILIYDNNHLLYKTVSITIPGDSRLDALYFASDKLFNSDSKIEILVGVRGSGGTKMLLYNEDGGNNIFDFGDRYGAFVFKDNSNNFKLMVTKVTSTKIYDIYSLSGTLNVSQENFLNKQNIIGFPNPSSKTINITNPLKNNENDKIQVYNINGKKVIEKRIIGNGENIELDISELSKGIYSYRIREFGNKFVKE